jgi:hypothetical protein
MQTTGPVKSSGNILRETREYGVYKNNFLSESEQKKYMKSMQQFNKIIPNRKTNRKSPGVNSPERNLHNQKIVSMNTLNPMSNMKSMNSMNTVNDHSNTRNTMNLNNHINNTLQVAPENHKNLSILKDKLHHDALLEKELALFRKEVEEKFKASVSNATYAFPRPFLDGTESPLTDDSDVFDDFENKDLFKTCNF